MRRKWYYLALCPILAFLLLTGNCVCTETITAPERDNPNDPTAPNYVPPPAPVATVSNLRNNPAMNVDSVSIRFTGNDKVAQFSYYLKNVDAGWSAWGSITEARYTLLDEGSYMFLVRGRSDQQVVGPTDTVRFSINALQGGAVPALMLRPKRGINASIGDTLRFDIMAEEVSGVIQTDLFVGFNATLLGVLDVRPGGFFPSSDTLRAITIDTTVNATVNIFTGFPSALGASGSGVLATILFQAKAQGSGAITLTDSCKLIGPSGVYQTMPVQSKVNTTYTIE